MSQPNEVYENFKSIFQDEVREKFVVFWLNTANKVIGFEIISEGDLNSSIASPREIFRGAIVSSCAGIILAHNHPSGNATPSNEDIKLTSGIVDAGKIIGIKVLDHIIFGNDSYTSFIEKRLI
ncbi:MAG: JAB domain-containing protein [Nitrospiria bacterium]